MRPGKRRQCSGFTLAEVACVIGIASIVTSLAVVGGLHARHKSAVSAASADVLSLETALRAFQSKRGGDPSDINHDGLTTTDEIVKQLKSWGTLRQDFDPIDPWGQPYVIVLRRDYPVSEEAMRDYNYYPLNDVAEGFQVYSLGPDGVTGTVTLEEASRDDIANFSS